MNPWGWLFIALAVIAIYIGIKGTENSVYAFITGQQVKGGSSSSTGAPIVPNAVPAAIQNTIIGAGKAVQGAGKAVQNVGATVKAQAPPQLNNSIPATIQNWLIGAGKALGL